jgi:hypothetical protein
MSTNWTKMLLPPFYLGAACGKSKASWPPDRDRSDSVFSDEQKREMKEKGIGIKGNTKQEGFDGKYLRTENPV